MMYQEGGDRGQNRGRSRSPPAKAAQRLAADDEGPLMRLEMPKLDLLIIGPSKAGKTTMMQAFGRNEPQQIEDHPLHMQVGMNVTSQNYNIGVGNLSHTTKLYLWDPAMQEFTHENT